MAKSLRLFSLERLCTRKRRERRTSSGAGVNYLDVCRKAVSSGDVELQKALDGIKAVGEGSKEYFRMEYPCHSPTRQRWFLMLVTPLKRSEGGAVVAPNDITERKRAEEELRASKERFQLLVETTNAIAWEADLETWVFTYVSPQVTKLLGYESAEWYKQTSGSSTCIQKTATLPLISALNRRDT